MASVLRRWTDRLTRSTAELEADELQSDCHALGATPIVDCAPRTVVQVSGVLRNLVIPARTDVPALVGELYDGTGVVRLVWLGRREIPGISAGRFLRAQGRICERDGVGTIFNPRYELEPQRPGE